MEKLFKEKCGLLYWNADLMWTFLSKKVHMWTFGAKCGPIWQHCLLVFGKFPRTIKNYKKTRSPNTF